MRRTRVDPDNEALRRITEDLDAHFRPLLCAVAWPPDGPMMLGSSEDSLTFMCAHDSLTDHATQAELSPHLIVDCTNLCKQAANAAMASRMGDTEETSYAAEAAVSQKAVKTAKKFVTKATTKATKVKKKADAAAGKVEKLGDKASKKLKATAEKTKTQFRKAQEAVRQAQLKAAEAEKIAKKALATAEEAAKIQAIIAKCWCAVVNTLSESNSHFTDASTGPAYVESFQVYLVPCLKCKGSACQCKYSDII